MSELSRLTDAHLQVGGAAALSASLIEQINQVCAAVENSKKDVTLLVEITGADGPTGDLWPADLGVHTVNRWEQALRRLERLPAVTMAVVSGPCAGPALDVLLTTDYRVATPDVRLRVPLVARSTWPGMALFRLANQIGIGHSRQLALLGMEIPAARAMAWGLLDDVVEGAASRARDMLNSFAGISGTELSIRRQLLIEASSTSFEDAVGPHLAACDRALRLADTGADSAAVILTDAG